jgi:hypothetical protein
MKTVYKYPLNQVKDGESDPGVVQDILMPVFSNILHVQVQNGIPTLWAETDDNPNTIKETRTIRFYMTGEPFDSGMDHIYIGTIHVTGYVLHIYELQEYHE